MEKKQALPPIKLRKKSNKKTYLAILTVVFLVVLVGSMALGAWKPSEEEKPENMFEYSGYEFYKLDDGTVATQIQAQGKTIPIQFRLDPRNASKYEIEQGVLEEILTSGKVYITFNPNQEDLGKIAVASAEISRIMGLYGIPTVGAYTEDSNPVNPNVPLRTCEDVSNKTGVVLMELSDETKVTLEDKCVHVKAENPDELILISDKLGFNLLGIKV